MKIFFLIATIIGFVIPARDMYPFFYEHGFNIPLILGQLYTNRMSAAFVNDFWITAVVILAFTAHEGWRIGFKASQILACFGAMVFGGASVALPLFLYLREKEREKRLKAAE